MPSSRVNRPSAFDVSWPEDTPSRSSSNANDVSSQAPSTNKNGKRPAIVIEPRDQQGLQAGPKRRKLPDADYYRSPRNIEVIEESRNLFDNEDPEDEDKPVRLLSNFSVFDIRHRNEFISLSLLEDDDTIDREIQAAGYATEQSVEHAEEDEGQAEDFGPGSDGLFVKLTTIRGFYIDYKKETAPVYLETQWAWYILRNPSDHYRPFFQHFLVPRRVAQHCIGFALRRPTASYDDFQGYLFDKADPFGRVFEQKDIDESHAELCGALDDIAIEDKTKANEIRMSFLIRRILPNAPVRKRRRRTGIPPQLSRNPDLAVLDPDNQTPTHATPRISALAKGLFRETIRVVGARINIRKPETEQENAALTHLKDLLKRAHRMKSLLCDYRKEDQWKRGSKYLNAVQVDGQTYRIGDVILTPIGSDETDDTAKKSAPGLPSPDSKELEGKGLWDYFWFAQIKYINWDRQQAHVQWFNHSSKTIMQEIHDSQELFLHHLCNNISLNALVGKVTVHRVDCTPDKINPIPFGQYYYKMIYDPDYAVFSNIDYPSVSRSTRVPLDHCQVCEVDKEKEENESARVIEHNAKAIGVSFRNITFHLFDFVLYSSSEKGPANIGQVKEITSPRNIDNETSPAEVVVKKVGRVAQISGNVLPEDELQDERHLFITETGTDVIAHTSIIQVIYVRSSIPCQPLQLDEWLAFSPDHFHVRYSFPSVDVTDWKSKKVVPHESLELCRQCITSRVQHMTDMTDFVSNKLQTPLRALDLFGGAGAFGVGMEMGSRCIKVTHAIEISPSAAKTYKNNSPDTIVYNQCINEMLKYTVKSKEAQRKQGITVSIPSQLWDRQNQTPVPHPPKQNKIDVIIAGLPCQTHSRLNMYKQADDRKSNLILPLLSFIDFYRPTYVFLENVPGFLMYNLLAIQKDRYNLEGGIKQGGVKLLVRVLVDMGYQLRFALLQAGQYGTPQNRIRFILIAAKMGSPLPEIPAPTHDFELVSSMPIRFSFEEDEELDEEQEEEQQAQGRHAKRKGKNKRKPKKWSRIMRPIDTRRGRGLHPSVSISDAIWDLPRFDWKHPQPLKLEEQMRLYFRTRRTQGKIPAIACPVSQTQCGLKTLDYHCRPRTRYQKIARVRVTRDLQHFTRTWKTAKVMKCIEVPLKAKADFLELRKSLAEFQTHNPVSWARRKDKRGLYGRLHEHSYFPTTVTNVDPTGKQSWVLNPWKCHRMLTVRELARSQGFPDDFVFDALNDNVVTVSYSQSSILVGNADLSYTDGNAVPLPLSDALGRQLQRVEYQRWKDRLEVPLEGREVIDIDGSSEEEN
uniref:DNA (cytosine-5-)-methyltransferase n=1 Tax=Moniliophthora roreri TaxID=221103 RepID=A0A0W0FBK8_MONRR